MGEINEYIAEIIFAAALLLLFWIVSRSVRLWYWKVDAQLDTLKSIDEKVRQLRLGQEKKDEGAVPVNVPELIEEIEEEIEKIVAANKAKTIYPERESAVYSKSGPKRVYTEQELEELIRD